MTHRPVKMLGILLALGALPAAAPLVACDSGAFAAGTTIGVMRRASPGVQRMRDPDILEAAFPASIQQLEGLLEVKPDDAVARAMLARSYASYGYGFLEDHYEVAQRSDDATEEQIEHWRERASLAYLRGREVVVDQLDRAHPEGGGFAGAQRGGLEAFTAHLRRFDNASDQAPLLFWAAYNWVRYIGLHRDDMSAIADVAYVRAIADRVIELDPNYMDRGPVALRAGLMAAAPPALGGRPGDAKVALDEVIEATGRRNLLYLVTEAQLCAVPLQDRALFQSLLEEVLAFDVDSHPDQRIPNLLAQRRARRYLDQIEDLFIPVDDAPADEGADAAAPTSE